MHNVLMQMPDNAPPHLVGVLEQLLRLLRQVSLTGDMSFSAAAVLSRLVREGPHRLTDLADREAVSQPGMTQLVSRLERDGLVERRPSADDGRVAIVHVTRAGRAIVERRRVQRAQAFDELLAQLSASDRASIDAAIPALIRLVELAPATFSDPDRLAVQP
jgi:DNA-binding MarR family transcriptional regulator